MSRVPILDPDAASEPVVREFFAATTILRGRIPNSARTWGHAPDIAKLFLLMGVPLQREGAGGILPCKIKEMAVLKTSHVNSCAY